MEDRSATKLKTTGGTAGPLGAKTEVASDAAEFGSTEPVASEELTEPPEVTQGMVGPAV